jgi:tRNA threonylcarbamoyladenosine biosynthesis protein TsaE
MRKHLKIKLSEARQTARAMAKTLHGGEILALIGPLGGGKTTFTQALGRALNIRRRITSPTFILLQKFVGRLPGNTKKPVTLYHLDLYRTNGWREVQTLGLDEIWGKPDTVTVIEWADKIRRKLPPRTLYIYLRHDKP